MLPSITVKELAPHKCYKKTKVLTDVEGGLDGSEIESCERHSQSMKIVKL